MSEGQLRIDWGQGASVVNLLLVGSGATVLADAIEGIDRAAWVLGASGVRYEPRTDALAFAVADLERLVGRDDVVIHHDAALAPIVAYHTNPPPPDEPALLEVVADELRLSWHDDVGHLEELIVDDGVAALLASRVAFVADDAAWARLRERSHLPILAGRIGVNLDGYLEITATRPQLVEAAPIPGLFRVDANHYGVALAYADAVRELPGFELDGYLPGPHPARTGRRQATLSPVGTALVDRIVSVCAAGGGAVVVRARGGGRRVLALAAVEALDAWPALVVAPPSRLWSWQRALGAVGRRARAGGAGDVWLCSWAGLSTLDSGIMASTCAIVFDDPIAPAARTVGVDAALAALDGVEAIRLAVVERWPTVPEQQIRIARTVRPGEFRTDVDWHHRYPSPAAARLAEHLAAYLVTSAAVDADRRWRRSGVRVLAPSAAQLRALATLDGDADEAAVREILSGGPADGIGPKIAEAVALARVARAAGRRCVIVTRSARSAGLVAGSLRPLPVVTLTADRADTARADLAIVVAPDGPLGDLRGWDTVVIVDWPDTTAWLDAAVGAADSERGPALVEVLHLEGTADDRFAELAVRRGTDPYGRTPA